MTTQAHTDKLVVLARGLGTRMQKTDPAAELSEDEAAAAKRGMKAMMPTLGRPFLDFVLSAAADAGCRRVCLVIGPEHDAVRAYYGETAGCRRLEVSFAVQQEPRGTADAVAATELFAGSDPVLVTNSDNYYPADAIRALRETEGNALVAFSRDALLAQGNIPAERIAKFALVRVGPGGLLAEIHEKPDADTLRAIPEPVCVSMNCWRFTPAIFDACRAIEPSPRGELEITDAVRYCMTRLGKPFRAVPYRGAVLDLSCRADLASVKERLRGIEVRL